MLNHLRKAWPILIAIFILSGLLTSAEALNRAVYDRYISAYQSYQFAISSGLSAEVIKGKLAEYKSAKAAYDQEYAQNPTPPDEELVVTDHSVSIAETLSAPVATAVGEGSSSIPQTKTAYPAELQAIVTELWSASGRKKPDSAIQKLQDYYSKNMNSLNGAIAGYELAKALEWLKQDLTAAAAVLQRISTNKASGAYAAIAANRLKFIKASVQHLQWKQTLISRTTAMEDAYKSYRDTSWLAFPVKLSRYGSYVSKIWNLDKAERDYKKFQLWYEDMAAVYMPPPEIVFDMFKPAAGKCEAESQVRLIYTNSEAWYTRWKLIDEAQKSLDIQYFIVDDDIFGMSLSGLLLKKAKEGLKIRFMMDARGTKEFTRKFAAQDYMQELAKYPNVEIKVFNPVHQNLATMLLDIRKIMASNHDKIVVVDNEYAIVGGRNISKDYFVDPEDHPTAYRDCDVLIRSTDVAAALDAAFTEEFFMLKQYEIQKNLGLPIHVRNEMLTAYAAMDGWIRGNGAYIAPKAADAKTLAAVKEYNAELAVYKHLINFDGFDPMKGSHEAPVKIIDKNSLVGSRNDITDQLVRFIDSCKHEVIIQNPYVVLTERAEAALKRASRRGVRIILHTNSPISTDSAATQAMFYRDWKRILKEIPTAAIYVFYGQRKLHAKTFTFDGKVGIVGTYNMDYISEEVNSEVVAAINHRPFALELRSGIMSNIAESKKYEIQMNEKGEAESVLGPDDMKTKNLWIIKTLSRLGFAKYII